MTRWTRSIFAALTVSILLSVTPAHADEPFAEDIPNLNCQYAILAANGIHVTVFRQWYLGYLTGLYSAGEQALAWALYMHPEVVLQVCRELPRITVYRMLEIAKQRLTSAEERTATN